MNEQLTCEKLNQVGLLNSLPIEKSVKHMNVNYYNATFVRYILACVKEVVGVSEKEEETGPCGGRNKEIRGGATIQRNPLYVHTCNHYYYIIYSMYERHHDIYKSHFF